MVRYKASMARIALWCMGGRCSGTWVGRVCWGLLGLRWQVARTLMPNAVPDACMPRRPAVHCLFCSACSSAAAGRQLQLSAACLALAPCGPPSPPSSSLKKTHAPCPSVPLVHLQLVAGEQIDVLFGASMGISTLASAALGNLVADVVGVSVTHQIQASQTCMRARAYARVHACVHAFARA